MAIGKTPSANDLTRGFIVKARISVVLWDERKSAPRICFPSLNGQRRKRGKIIDTVRRRIEEK